jgi:predicted PurR-regulated permease PerM
MDRLELWDREGLAPISFVILLLLAGAAFLYTLAPFVHDIVLAFVVVGLFGPLFLRLQKRIPNPWLRSAVVTVAALVLVAAPLVWLGLTLFEEATAAYEMAKPGLLDGSTHLHVRALLGKLGIDVSQAELLAYFASYRERVSEFALGEASHLLNNLIAAFLHFCIVIVLVFYTLVEGSKLKDFLFRLSPLPDDQDELIVSKFTIVARGVLISNGVTSILQGIVGGVGMAVVGLRAPVLWGSVMAIAAFLPVFGVAVVVLPAGIYLMAQNRMAEGVAFITVCMSVSFVLEHVLKTKLMGVGVRMHDVPLFLSILGGLAAFGFIGLLYGPLIVAMFLTLTELYMTHYRPQFAARFVRRKRTRGSIF